MIKLNYPECKICYNITKGRDITLEDCLIAIEKKYRHWETLFSITARGILFTKADEKGEFLVWELGKSLFQQEQETIDFLFDLIVKT